MENRVESNYLFYLKSVAVFCVVCAHTAAVPKTAGYINQICSQFLNILGTMGVPIFFIISGYFYGGNLDPLGLFWKKKINKILIPWIFCDTIVWFYVVIRKGGVSFWGWLQFLLGVEHSTYYLTILFFFFLILWKARYSMVMMTIGIILSIAGMLLTAGHFSIMSQLNALTITAYLNPIYWIGYFCSGIMIEHYGSLLGVGKWCGKLVWMTGGLLLLSIIFHLHFGIPYTYFSEYAVVNVTLSTMFLMGILYVCIARNSQHKMLLSIGKNSFSIYLLHQLLAGAIVWITSKADIPAVTLMRPFIVIFLLMICFVCLDLLNNKLDGKLKFIYKLIGKKEK